MTERKKSGILEKKALTPYELLSLIISAAGLVAVIIVWTQTRQMTASLESTAWQTVQSHQLELNKVFIENPGYMPYFYSGASISESDKNYNKAVAIADLKLDFFDSLYGQAKHLPELQGDSAAWKAWERYILDSFEQSPIMCKRINEVPCWYTSDFLEVAGRKCAQTPKCLEQSEGRKR
ncbi:MAG: hypothetical protein A2075_23440 [Geobacteraceae bacterium GWC2_58_44]|nr:MAG: hypothetical protein A2075_23440 [Geobacteraceae bacterium GWC2_58_44]HBG07585.1 hypothetical protein [Geobacter sp.]